MGCLTFAKVFPSAVGRSLHYKRAGFWRCIFFFLFFFFIRIQVYLNSDCLHGTTPLVVKEHKEDLQDLIGIQGKCSQNLGKIELSRLDFLKKNKSPNNLHQNPKTTTKKSTTKPQGWCFCFFFF